MSKFTDDADKMLQNIIHMRAVDEAYDANVRMTVGRLEREGFVDFEVLALDPEMTKVAQSMLMMMTTGCPASLVPTIVRVAYLTMYVMGTGTIKPKGGDNYANN